MTAATNAICEKILWPWGYVKAKDAVSVGFTVDPVAHGCSGGDDGGTRVRCGAGRAYQWSVVVAVDGKPLTESEGELARTTLFGRAGDARVLVTDPGGKHLSQKLVLGRKG